MESTVKTTRIDEMIKITAGYVKEGVQFRASFHDNMWHITLTGGH